MAATTIPLTVQSVNNKNLATAVTEIFTVERMNGIIANQNLNNSVTITDSNSAADTVVHTSWSFTFRGERLSTLYWSATYVSTTATVNVYTDSARGNRVATGTCTIGGGQNVDCFLAEVNNSGISGYVIVDKDLVTSPVGTLTLVGNVTSKDLQLSGATQFEYYNPTNGKSTKYTVTESVAAIQLLVNPSEWLEATRTLTSAELLAGHTTPIEVIAAPAVGTYIDVISAEAFVDYNSAAYATNTSLSLVTTHASYLWTAATVLAATGDVRQKFAVAAGSVDAATSLKAQVSTADPITGDSPVTVKVVYRIATV